METVRSHPQHKSISVFSKGDEKLTFQDCIANSRRSTYFSVSAFVDDLVVHAWVDNTRVRHNIISEAGSDSLSVHNTAARSFPL